MAGQPVGGAGQRFAEGRAVGVVAVEGDAVQCEHGLAQGFGRFRLVYRPGQPQLPAGGQPALVERGGRALASHGNTAAVAVRVGSSAAWVAASSSAGRSEGRLAIA